MNFTKLIHFDVRNGICKNVGLFRYTLDRCIIEVNVEVEVRLDKPKTRISYVDMRVFVGGVREI